MAIHGGDLGRSVVALALLAQCVAAHASLITAPEIEPFNLTPALVTYKVSNDGSNPDTPGITTEYNGPKTASSLLNFDKFNTGLGTLTAVTISFESAFSLGPSVSVTFVAGPDPNNPDEIQFFADGALTLSLTGTGLISPQSPLTPPTASATCTTDHINCSSTPAPTIGNFNGTTSGLSLAPFLGPGTYNLTAGISSALGPRIIPDNGTAFVDNATIDTALTSNWAGNVSVVYTYDPVVTAVPEPLTLYLLIAGVLGFALFPRRRA